MTYQPELMLIPERVEVLTGSEARPAVGARPVIWDDKRAAGADHPTNINFDTDQWWKVGS